MLLPVRQVAHFAWAAHFVLRQPPYWAAPEIREFVAGAHLRRRGCGTEQLQPEFEKLFLFKGHPGGVFSQIDHKRNRSVGAIGVIRVILTAYLKVWAFICLLVVELG